MAAQPAVIVLAAGRGSRFLGTGHKLAQRLGSATVLAATLRHAVATHLPVVVVTTEAFAETARDHVAARDVIVLPEPGTPGMPSLGMGYSISAGVSAASDASGWLILPGDMPMVRSDTMLEVARELSHHAVVFAQHRGLRGHPVGFSSELYSELVELRGDEGARRLVARYAAFGVEVDDPGTLLDVDTVADLESARLAHQGSAVPVQRV
ncbi:nucleotidyltransferase family protein [Piscinibacter sp.]|uniref:nucleotidyltransferase family protein n=1 Tax=Piscinibacter sp. TaxID=1903157 RepID=UPI0039E38480